MDHSELHDKESEFHDRWAEDTRVQDIHVHAAFEAPTAPENRYILRRMGDLRGKRILDIGCGLGESSVYFALKGADVTATDLSPQMVQCASRLADYHNTRITAVVSPAESLNAPDASFDFVYTANTIHHVHDRDAFLQHIRRVLKPGGRFFSWDPLAYNPAINLYRRMATEVRTEDESPLNFDDLALVKEYFTQVEHREFWICTLALFAKYYFIDRVHPNSDRYWKRILRENNQSLWWWQPLRAADAIVTRLPLLRRLAWNMVITGERPV